jgi:hypothetical protein
MNDAAAVGERQRVAKLHRDLDKSRQEARLLRAPSDFRDHLGQALASDELHDDVRPRFVRAEVVNGNDVRVLELSRDLRFFRELLGRRFVAVELRPEHLDGDAAAEHGVARYVDAADAAPIHLPDPFEPACRRRVLPARRAIGFALLAGHRPRVAGRGRALPRGFLVISRDGAPG